MKFKRTRYAVSIGSVDGETSFECSTPNASIALKFLQQYDHEGSVVELDEMDNSLPLAQAQETAITHPDEHAWRVLEEAVKSGQ